MESLNGAKKFRYIFYTLFPSQISIKILLFVEFLQTVSVVLIQFQIESVIMLKLIIATTNIGKIREFNELLKDLPVQLKSLEDFAKIPEVEETGETFAENAELKANYYALKTECWTLADDSGLEVFDLDNAPGVYSARFAGKSATDTENINKLLESLKKINKSERRARFVCAMTISDEAGNIKFTAEGHCYGKITLEPFGDKGFGYDSIFTPTGYSKTFGQIPCEIKHRISHRSVAVNKIMKYFSDFPLP